MRLPVFSLSIVTCLALTSAVSAQTFDFGFDDGLPCGGTISTAPGGSIKVSGHLTLTTSDAGVGGLTQSVRIEAMDGGAFCVDPARTETCGPTDCKPPFFEPTGILALFPDPTSFVVQNAENGCENGVGDPTDTDNGGRIGLVDGTVFNIGDSLAAGSFLTLPVDFDLTAPTDPTATFTYEIRYEDGLKAEGQPQANSVSFTGGTRGPCDSGGVTCGVCTIIVAVSQRGSLPGDTAGDGPNSVLDAIALLQIIFEGGDLPCDDGFNGACNLELLDSNGDGEIDMSDAIYYMRWALIGGPAPVGGNGDGSCSSIPGAPESCDQ